MSIPTPVIQVIVPMVLIAAIMSVLPVGFGLAVLIGLIVVGGIARAVARRSESARWLSTGIYAGALTGFVLSLMRNVS